MITRPNTIRYSIDKLEMSYRFGKDNHIPVLIIDDLLAQLYLRDDVTVKKQRRGSHRVGSSFNRCTITFKMYPFETVYVETGVAVNKFGRFPYAKFGFNHDRIFKNESAANLFLSVMLDILPGGGYTELIDEGNVLYVEFAIDHNSFRMNENMIRMNEVDIFSPFMDSGDVFVIGPDGNLETICISNFKEKPRKLSFAAYDKKKQLIAKDHRNVRMEVVRIEAKRRFQPH